MTIRSLSEELRKKAEKEINEVPSKVSSDLKELRAWITEQPHLHTIKPTDQWLLAFLRGCKFNMEKCKRKLDMYYTLKTTLPEFYGNRNPFEPRIQEILKLGLFLPLRKCNNEESPRICLVRLGVFGQVKLPITELIKVCLMVLEVLMLECDNFTISGEDIILDTKDVGINLLYQWTPTMAKKLALCSEKAMSVRLKSMHVLNSSSAIKAALALLKLFMAEKIKKRIFLYSKNNTELNKHFDKSILPEEYGGTDGNIQELTDYWKAKVESYSDWYTATDACSDESKRLKLTKDSTTRLSGVLRSFRNLELD